MHDLKCNIRLHGRESGGCPLAGALLEARVLRGNKGKMLVLRSDAIQQTIKRDYLAVMENGLLGLDAWIPLTLFIPHVLCACHPRLHN